MTTTTHDTEVRLERSSAGILYKIRETKRDGQTYFDVNLGNTFITSYSALSTCREEIRSGCLDAMAESCLGIRPLPCSECGEDGHSEPNCPSVTPRPTPARRVAPTLDRLVWTHEKSGARLDHGRAMTATEAVDLLRSGASNAHTFRASETRVSFVSGFGTKIAYVGTLPVPTDPHAAVERWTRDSLLDLPLNIRQGDLLIKALDAVADSPCPDCPVCAPLLQMLATTAMRS